MKGLLLAVAILMVGCAEYQTLEDLELAALESGDWSAVEQRERLIEKRKARRGMRCSGGRILVCENRGTGSRCRCSGADDVRAILDTL